MFFKIVFSSTRTGERKINTQKGIMKKSQSYERLLLSYLTQKAFFKKVVICKFKLLIPVPLTPLTGC